MIGMIAGTLFMAFIGCFLNAFVLLPAYGKAFGMPVDALIAMGTAVNPAINSLLTFLFWQLHHLTLIVYDSQTGGSAGKEGVVRWLKKNIKTDNKRIVF